MPKQSSSSKSSSGKAMQASSPSMDDRVLLEKTLSEGRYDGFVWKTTFKLTQRNYIKFYGEKRYETKYNKVELIGEKNGHRYIVNMSLEAFSWLMKTIQVEIDQNKRSIESMGERAEDVAFTVAKFQDFNTDRYYFYYRMNEWMSQIIYSDGFKAYGISLSSLARNSLLDVNSRISYLLQWNNKTYQDKMELENFVESLFIFIIAKEIKLLMKERCVGCKTDGLEHECCKQLQERPDGCSLFEEVMGDGLVDIKFIQMLDAFTTMMNIAKSDGEEAAKKRITSLKEDKNRLFGLVWNHLESLKDPNKIDSYNFDGIFSFAEMK